MLKTEIKLIPERGIFAVAIEGNGAGELPNLDLLAEAFSGRYKTECGFASSNRLIIHVSGMPEEIFKPKED